MDRQIKLCHFSHINRHSSIKKEILEGKLEGKRGRGSSLENRKMMSHGPEQRRIGMSGITRHDNHGHREVKIRRYKRRHYRILCFYSVFLYLFY